MDLSQGLKKLDLGCGPKKLSGYLGVDHHAYDGVDVVWDLTQRPWPFAESSFESVRCHHLIEHIPEIRGFLDELHRIMAPGGKVEFITPHFSSVNSYADPTHCRHLSALWYKVFTDGYLSAGRKQFELVSSEVTFGKSLLNFIPRLIIRLKGQDYWERKYAFIFPGTDIQTVLTAVK